jgi:hypothetical protein
MQPMLVILKKKDLTIDAEKFHLPSDCYVTDFERSGGSEHSVINLKTAKALDLKISEQLLQRDDSIIE